MKEEIIPIQDEIVLYQSEDGNVKVDVLFQDETVWLTQSQLCMLFGKSKATISEHIKHIFEEGELDDKLVDMVKLWESRVEVIWREIYDSGEQQENATIRIIKIVQTKGELQKRQLFENFQ